MNRRKTNLASKALPSSVPTEGNTNGFADKRPLIVVRGERSGRRLIDFTELWHYRELAWLLAWRDLKLRYSQTVLGFSWAIIQPLFSTGLFTLIFGKLAKMPSDGVPYAVFSFTALLPWMFFANALGRCSNSLVANTIMISKVYFPRILLPVGTLLPGFVDFGIGLLVFIPLMARYGLVPGFWDVIVGLPLVTLIGTSLVFGLSLWFNALNVRYRDIGNLIPFLIQFVFFATPITYPLAIIPEKYRYLAMLNPMVGIIESYRSIFLNRPWELRALALSSVIAAVALFGGLYYFRKAESTFADVI